MAVVGIDGCRGGWVAVVWRPDSLDVHWWDAIERLGELSDVEVAAIDIPIGLSVTGFRQCDVLARARLPGRAATVFNAPPRACLQPGLDYGDANALSRSVGGRGLSRQSFGLIEKIREVDDFVATSRVALYEVHPEVSFAHLNGGTPLGPKTTLAGATQRRAALRAAGVDIDHLRGSARRAAIDDVLDAAVCALTARRIARGDATRLPDPADVDETGKEMVIRV